MIRLKYLAFPNRNIHALVGSLPPARLASPFVSRAISFERGKTGAIQSIDRRIDTVCSNCSSLDDAVCGVGPVVKDSHRSILRQEVRVTRRTSSSVVSPRLTLASPSSQME